jgi:cytochrome c oxidase cbb3-type subunit 3
VKRALVFLLLVAPAAALTLAACDRPPSADGLREWSPQDHDKTANNGQQAAPSSAADQAQMLIEMSWQQSCAPCHGPIGHGDGPKGSLVKAPDLTDAAWQAKVTDADIAKQIHEGKGLMPKFDTLPDAVVSGLIARIRASRGH